MTIHGPLFAVAVLLLPIAAVTAEPPATTTAATTATAPAASAPAAATSPATPPAAAAAAPAAAPDPAISKVAHSLGYKARQHDGKTVYCKSETKVGTSFPSTTCLSEEQVVATVKRAEGNRDSVEALQRAFLVGAPSKEPQMGMRGQ